MSCPDTISVLPTRCSRMRYAESSCAFCIEACHRDAVRLDTTLSIDAERCTRCGCCTASCPNGALAMVAPDVVTLIHRLKSRDQPVLGCQRAVKTSSHERLACLGHLGEKELIACSLLLEEPLQLNMIECAACVNRHVVDQLQELIDRLTAEIDPLFGERLRRITDPATLKFTPEFLGRRGFFSSVRQHLTATVLTAVSDMTGPDAVDSHAAVDQSLPQNMVALNRTIAAAPASIRDKLRTRFSFAVKVSSACEACYACAAVCPCGALEEPDNPSEEAPPLFKPDRCSGCGLCIEFCSAHALSLHP